MFNANWSANVIKEVGDKFHRNFVVGLRAHPLLIERLTLAME
jgi:hypothetical protein